MIEIINENEKYDVLIPTKLGEITEHYFKEMVKDVNIAEHHSIVALCFKEKLFNVMFDSNNKKDEGVKCVAKLIKIGGGLETIADCNIMDTVILNRSTIERAQHLHIKENTITTKFIKEYCSNNKTLTNAIFNGSYFGENNVSKSKTNSPYCWFVEYKIVPNNFIQGGFKNGIEKNNPFVTIRETEGDN